MKTEPNTKPPGERPNAPQMPPKQRVIFDKKVVAKIFDKWAENFANDPTSFDEILDSAGNVVDGYGESCVIYMQKLSDELHENEK